jgi:hypothetical protein|tara:strand:- start:13705 stop:14025 length:321 start_codon:yes stop_codon:yes gene_type:complete
MGRKKKEELIIKVGAKLTKKKLTAYHNNPEYRWWDSNDKVWIIKKLSDKLPKSVIVDEIRIKDNNTKVIIAKGDNTKVLWIEIDSNKTKTVSRPMVVPLTMDKESI